MQIFKVHFCPSVFDHVPGIYPCQPEERAEDQKAVVASAMAEKKK